MRIGETWAKSLIQRSKIPSIDYVINPYTGCAFACAYCYASFAGRFVDEPMIEWGNYVYVKKNAIKLARSELGRMSEEKIRGTVLLSSVTDPYQPLERQHRLTRGILQLLVEREYPGTVRILTKSPLVIRDLDLLCGLQNVEVGMTITTTDDSLSRWLEVRAPVTSKRLQALETLQNAGVRTFAFVGPLLPHFITSPSELDALIGRLSAVGVQEVYMEHINLKRYIRERMAPLLESEPLAVQDAYVRSRSSAHRKQLDKLVESLLLQHGLRLRFDEVVYHDQFRKQ